MDSTQRFSSRVDNYIKYRPAYPPAILNLLAEKCGLESASTVADIGSGTGILTGLLLRTGARVLGVEPNAEMRQAGERLLASYGNFASVAGTAEATTLPDQSVDLITAGQAFHWFDREKSRAEFKRILKANGWVALIWNDRNISDRPLFQEYEQLLVAYGTDYAAIHHKNIDAEKIGSFFGAAGCEQAAFPNSQTFDFNPKSEIRRVEMS